MESISTIKAEKIELEKRVGELNNEIQLPILDRSRSLNEIFDFRQECIARICVIRRIIEKDDQFKDPMSNVFN